MKSVTHVITTIELGGAEKQLLILVEQQIRLGYEVKIVFLKGNPELSEKFHDAGVVELISLRGPSAFKQVFLLRKLLQGSINVHAHLPRAELLAALCIDPNSRLTVTRHNAESFFPGAPKLLSVLLSRFVVSKSHAVIAISKAVADFLLTNSEVADNKKIQVIYYGKSEAASQTGKRVFPSEVIGTVARLTEQKDYATLLKAFSLFLQHKPEYRFQIIGVGHLEKKLKDLASDLGIEKNVEWLGKVSDPGEYISNWDLFVLTSLYEGFGLVLLESMASGVPVVASDNSAIPEVLGGDYVGLARTSDPGDFLKKMLSLLEQETRSKAIEQLGRNILRFDPEVMSVKVCELYA
jgi:glycosyltransferase involved in cell wall biosynthesis